MSVIDRTKDWN